MTAEVLLPIALEVAVPLRVAELRALDDEAFAAGLPPIGRGHWKQRTAADAPRPLLQQLDGEAAG